MAVHAPFNPRRGANQAVSATAASASISIDPAAKSVRVVNVDSANLAHIRIGTGAQTASATDLPIRPNSEIIVTKGEGENTLAYISASGAVLHVQTGEGGI